MAETKYRIDNSTAFKMALVCLLVEMLGLIGLVPVVGGAVNAFIVGSAEVLFFFWLKSYKVEFFKSPTNIIATIVTGAAEFLLGFLPAFSIQIGIIVFSSWAEDKLLGNKTAEPEISQPKKRREFKNFPEETGEATDAARPREMSDI